MPSTFVLMGNFQSQPAITGNTDYSVIKESFKALARIISQYQRLQVCIYYQKAITHQALLPKICRASILSMTKAAASVCHVRAS